VALGDFILVAERGLFYGFHETFLPKVGPKIATMQVKFISAKAHLPIFLSGLILIKVKVGKLI
jgi:hypothetical protein